MSRNGPAPSRAPLHRSVLITRPTLTGHGPVQGGIEVGGAIWPCISGCNRFGYKVRLFPAGLSVDFSQLLMYPHRIQNLAGEFDHSGRKPLTVSGYQH